jgi:hypothetical protein
MAAISKSMTEQNEVEVKQEIAPAPYLPAAAAQRSPQFPREVRQS